MVRFIPRKFGVRYRAGAALLAGLWLALPAVAPADVLRPPLVGLLMLAAVVEVVRTGAYTRGVERRGWWLIAACTTAGLLPFVGTLGGLLAGAGILLTCGRGWLADRWRLLDAAVALATVSALAVAYLVPALLDRFAGWDRVDTLVGATQVVFALSTMVLLSYRTLPRTRPDTWLVGGGFALAVAAASMTLFEPRAELWIPNHWYDVSLLLGNVAMHAGARLRRRWPERELGEPLGGVPPRHGMVIGDAWLVVLLGALAFEPTSAPTATLAVVATLVVLRHVRARRVEREHNTLTRQTVVYESAIDDHRRGQLEALTAALAARDGYTGEHGDGTVALVRRVAAVLHLDAETVMDVETVALLHDIGKIGIPDAILHKPGPLDESEWTIMREHPAVGERILRTIPGFESVALAVRHEHEHYDGAGYPDGLMGERIPLASRIVLVCDAYHAMTSDRPYRASIGREVALAELRRCAGTQFDPTIVEALIEALGGLAPLAPRSADAVAHA
jgi:hypothetical protein